MTTVDTLSKPFSIGAVFTKTFSVFGRAFVPIIIAAATVQVIAFLLGLMIGFANTPGAKISAFSGSLGFIDTILGTLSQGVIIFGAFRVLQDKPFDILLSVSQTLPRAFKLIGVAFICWLAIFVAAIALVIPGMIVAILLVVAFPACLIEGLGVFESLKRSQNLTKGYRWQIAGVYFLMMIIFAILMFALLALVGFSGLVATNNQLAQRVPLVILNVFTLGFFAILPSVIYSELRYIKEGVGIDEITDVFA